MSGVGTRFDGAIGEGGPVGSKVEGGEGRRGVEGGKGCKGVRHPLLGRTVWR